MLDVNAWMKDCDKYEIKGTGWRSLSQLPWLDVDGTGSFRADGGSCVFVKHGCKLSVGARSCVRLYSNSKLFIMGNFALWYDNFVHLASGAVVMFGEGYMNRYATVESKQYVEIGDAVIGPGSYITDTDWHYIFDMNGNFLNPSAPVKLCGHVWLAQAVTVLKGATIGQGSCIGAHSLVRGSIPPNCLAVGSPAKVVRTGIVWK